MIRPSLFFVLSPLLGARGRLFLARRLFNARIAEGAVIGIALIDATRIQLDQNSSIGHFSVIRNLDALVLEKDARIGTFNWIFGARGARHFASRPERTSVLVLREGASVTSRHILDCTDRIDIGAFSTVAGFRSQVLTHSIDVISNRQECSPVVIGPYSFIGSGAVLLKGARFPARAVLAAGSVYSGRSGEEHQIYSGVPAKPVKRLPEDAVYMRRTTPRVV
jgi:acetyltransferase-like isoleucine patch superfamily enzyme